MKAVAAASSRILSVFRGLPTAPGCRSLESRQDGVKELTAPKRTGSSAGSPVSAATARSLRARRRPRRRGGVERETRHICGPTGSEMRSCSSTSSAGRNRVTRAAVDLGGARPVAENERVRCGSVHEPERHAGIHRVHERALSLDEEQLSPARRTLDDEPLGCAGEEVGHDRVDRDPPASDRDAGLARRHEDGLEPRRLASRSSSTATVFFPIAQSEPTVSTIFASTSRLAPVGTLGPRRPAKVAELDAVPSGERGQLRILRDELVEAALDVEAVRDRALQELTPGRRKAPTLGRDSDDRDGGLERERVFDGRDDRNLLVRSPARAESRIATTGSGP